MTDKTDSKERDLLRIAECAARLVEHADFQLGGVLSADSKARDIPSRACSQVKARHLAALRDALAGRAPLAPSSFDAADMATASAQGFRDGVASLAASAEEPLVRYCPGCGSIGPVDDKYRDCCPDGGQARMIPEPLAKQCHDTFQIAIRELAGSGGAASAGSEPMFWVRLLRDGLYEGPVHHKSVGGKMLRDEKPGEWTPLYTHPSPPEGMEGEWIALPGTLPEPGTPVLLDIGKNYPIRAMWAAKHTVQAADDDTDWGEYVEADDMYYAPEGWYEWNECEDNHWRVNETPRAWAPLSPTSSADSRKGE